jgi:hypothetical protein
MGQYKLYDLPVEEAACYVPSRDSFGSLSEAAFGDSIGYGKGRKNRSAGMWHVRLKALSVCDTDKKAIVKVVGQSH